MCHWLWPQIHFLRPQNNQATISPACSCTFYKYRNSFNLKGCSGLSCNVQKEQARTAQRCDSYLQSETINHWLSDWLTHPIASKKNYCHLTSAKHPHSGTTCTRERQGQRLIGKINGQIKLIPHRANLPEIFESSAQREHKRGRLLGHLQLNEQIICEYESLRGLCHRLWTLYPSERCAWLRSGEIAWRLRSYQGPFGFL